MRRGLGVVLGAVCLGLWLQPACLAGPYVTDTSGVRWNDVSGVRWNDASDEGWNDTFGLRWNEVGGVRWSDAAGLFYSDSLGVRWNDASGVRWNDASGLEFTSSILSGAPSIDLALLNALSTLPDTSSIDVIVTYRSMPTSSDLGNLISIGVTGGTIFHRLPIIEINATRAQIKAISKFEAVRSVYANSNLSLLDQQSASLIGMGDVNNDPDLALLGGAHPTGLGVTIATIDTGVDTTHPDLPLGTKVLQNVRLTGTAGTGVGFSYPLNIENVQNSDLVLGHGTFVASVAAGSGAASNGTYKGVAPGAKIVALSAGDYFILNMLEGFDYVLNNASLYNVRVVNCSWGTNGWFDPDDPVNVATRALYDAGITVVFAAGNYGPAPDTMNPYAVAPWVIGVGSTRKDGRLSDFSSRGIFDELLYHPFIVAPGEGIIAAQPIHLSGVNGASGIADPSGGVTLPPGAAPYYTVASGTSFAAPHVAGVIALMLELRPDLTPSRIKQILEETATPMLSGGRAEVGAGRVDAWAALTEDRYPSRPFGTHVAGWLDQRPYRIEHLEPKVSNEYLPAAGTLSVPVTLPEGTVSWQATVAWGTLPGANDLDVRVTDASTGDEIARSQAFNGDSLFGRVDGIHLLGSPPSPLNLELSFKSGTMVGGQDFSLRQEYAVASLPDYNDVANLSPQDLETAIQAVTRHVLIGRGNQFAANGQITRGETARALALAAGLPQRIPGSPTFQDTQNDSDAPYIETVAGLRATRIVMDPIDPLTATRFTPNQHIYRLDFTASIVRAAGLESAAIQRAGETLNLVDQASIPSNLRGYVAVAIEQGLIAPVSTDGGVYFLPGDPLTRIEAARYLLRLLDLLAQPASSSLKGTPAAFTLPHPGGAKVHPSSTSQESPSRVPARRRSRGPATARTSRQIQ